MVTRFHCLATDYDGTLAHDGIVERFHVEALERLRASGRRLVMVTGREVEELSRIFPRLDLFDATSSQRTAPCSSRRRPAPGARWPTAAGVRRCPGRRRCPAAGAGARDCRDLAAARSRRARGDSRAGARAPGHLQQGRGHDSAVGREQGDWSARRARRLGLSRHNTVGVGDAENDHAFLSACGCAVAVAGALPALREKADHVDARRCRRGRRGALRPAARRRPRRAAPVGTDRRAGRCRAGADLDALRVRRSSSPARRAAASRRWRPG